MESSGELEHKEQPAKFKSQIVFDNQESSFDFKPMTELSKALDDSSSWVLSSKNHISNTEKCFRKLSFEQSYHNDGQSTHVSSFE